MRKIAGLAVLGGLTACQPVLEQPTPRVDAITPDLVCHAQRDTLVTVHGSGFTPTPVDTVSGPASLALPELTLLQVSGPTGEAASGSRVLDEADGLKWHGPGEMSFEITEDWALSDGVYTVQVQNPDGQQAALDAAMLAVAPPVLDSVSPELFCGEQEPVELTLQGQGFLEVEGEPPTVSVGDWSATAEVDDCQDLAGPVSGRSCGVLRVTVPAGSLDAGLQAVTVTNPAPADCESSEEVVVEVLPAPSVDEVVPPMICVEAGDTPTVILGSGFLFTDEDAPTIWIEGEAHTPEGRDGCFDLSGPSGGEVCDELHLTVAPADLELGLHEVWVTNPEPAACESDDSATLEVVPPPTISHVEPDKICDSGGSFIIHGSDFVPGSTVHLDGALASDVTWLDEGRLQVEAEGPLPTGLVTVTVTNPDGCADAAEAAIEVVRAPILFYVDPPVIYDGISVRASVYVAGIVGELTDLWIEEQATGAVTSLDFEWDGGSIVRATIPAGLPAGEYDVFGEQDAFCPFALPGGLYVESDLTVAIDRVDPPFAWTGEHTAVQVHAVDPAPDGMVQFEDVPRVYLNPVAGGTTATALRSVTWRRDALLDALVPPGLDPGLYDVIVVNPDGGVGLLEEGLWVTGEAPPRVDSVAPATVHNAANAEIIIQGAHFRDPHVQIQCQDRGTGAVHEHLDGEVTDHDHDFIVATIPSTTYPDGAVCVVLVINDDETWFEYAAISITNPAQNLFPWRAAPELETARRAPAAVAGRATATARFLYAIGGDDGSPEGAMDSIEFSAVSKFGELEGFQPMPISLPAPRTLAAVSQVGRFVYLVGGHDGVTPVSTVWRAQVLDPLAAPQYADLSVDYGEGEGLGGGTWSYRVAALFGEDDLINPGGESLASDPIVVRLPDLEDKLHLSLSWTPVDGAVGYRVYRSPEADAGSGSELWLADVTGTSLLDDGLATSATFDPLPLGSLGEWADMPSLTVPLQSPCVTTAHDPVEPDLHYLYVAGGLSGGVPLNVVRFLDIDVVDEGEQIAGSWTLSSHTLAPPRYECGAWTVDDRLHTVVGADESWVYFGGGRAQPLNSTVTQAGRVTTGGELESWQLVQEMSPVRAGYGVLSSGNQLYAFGGQNASASAGGVLARVEDPPTLLNWNNLGTSMAVPRYLMGSAQESAVIFVVGGATTGGVPTATVDFTNF